jgi:hypothetical protein
MMPRQRELGLFAAAVASAQGRAQPRDAQGRFVKVRYSAHRLRVLAKARQMRADMGLPPSPYLMPFGLDPEEQIHSSPETGEQDIAT